MRLNLFNLSILLFILSFTTNLFAAKLDKFTFTSWNKPDLDVFYHPLPLKGECAALWAAQLLPLFEEANREPIGPS